MMIVLDPNDDGDDDGDDGDDNGDDGDDGVCDERMTDSQCDVMMNRRFVMMMIIMLWILKNNPINDKVAMGKS